MSRFLLLLLLAASTGGGSGAEPSWRAGFFTVGMGQPISQVPWTKLTHLILCCAAADSYGAVSKNWLEPASFPEVIGTAHANDVRVLLSVGGPSATYLANTSPAMVGTFAANIVGYILNNGFDGVDLDWEEHINVLHYADLVTRLRRALPDKLITVDSGNWDNLVNAAVATYPLVDRLNVMCYDMADGNPLSWHHAALLQAGQLGKGSCDWRVGALTDAGIPPGKLNIGIPAFGYAWNGATQPSSRAALDKKQWGYNQIVGNPSWWNGGYNKRYDHTHKANYLSIPATNQFVTYNDTDSVRDIVRWGRKRGAGGFFLAYLYQEYFSTATGPARTPLTSVLYEEATASDEATQ
jgi:chitinase